MRFYNHEIKERFLNEIYENEDTREVISYIFDYAKGNEEQLGKDLYDFTTDDLSLVIANSDHPPRSAAVARTRGRYIARYMTWAIKNNLRRSNINPMHGIEDEWYDQFVDPLLKQFISKPELEEICSRLENKNDEAVLRLLFEGIYGYQSSEIRNLKKDDLKNIKDNKLRLYDDRKGERFLQIDEKLIEILEKAAYEREYDNKNGNATGKWAQSELVDNEYVIRPARRGRVNEDDRASQITVITRIRMIADEFGLEDLNPKSIQRSGMIYAAYKLLMSEDKTELDKHDFEMIGDRFNLNKISNNGYEYYNTSVLREYINEKNIKKLYPDF